MNQLTLSERLLYCTVKIDSTLNSGNTSTGTGFRYNFFINSNNVVPVLVTNKHVILDSKVGTLRFHKRDKNGILLKKIFYEMHIEDFENAWIMHPDSNIDLCVLPLAEIFQEAQCQDHSIWSVSIDETLIPDKCQLEDLMPLEDIIMVGYPDGIWDSVNNLPIFRRGITATPPNIQYNGNDEFLIDCAVFPGSSGSPIFLYNQGMYYTKKGTHIGSSRVFLLGIVRATFLHTANGQIIIENIPTQNISTAETSIPNNLGLVIRSQKIKDFEPILTSRLKSKNN